MTVSRGASRRRDIWDDIEAISRGAHRRIDELQRSLKAPTHPVYDSNAFPNDATVGQIVRDQQDLNVVWIYGEDEEWHQIGALAWGALETHNHFFGSGDGTLPFNYPSDAGLTVFGTNDPVIYGCKESEDALEIKRPGTYVILYAAQAIGNVPADDEGFQVSFNTLSGPFDLPVGGGTSGRIGKFVAAGSTSFDFLGWSVTVIGNPASPGAFSSSYCRIEYHNDTPSSLNFQGNIFAFRIAGGNSQGTM